jgi:hypothetical protein
LRGANVLKRQEREEAVAAGRAAIGWNMRQSEKARMPAIYHIPRHALEIEVTTTIAMGAQDKKDRQGPAVKAKVAGEASPRT